MEADGSEMENDVGRWPKAPRELVCRWVEGEQDAPASPSLGYRYSRSGWTSTTLAVPISTSFTTPFIVYLYIIGSRAFCL
jgi:hypothetical protein